MTRLLPLDAATYRPHELHRTERIWSETNCYVDIWIEVLNALGLEPLAAGAFALSSDFEGDQWTFFKFPPEDLRELFGIRVFEMNPWRGVLDHVVEHLESGRLITVEVDAWYLPDTAGVSYRIERTKTTIVPNLVDVEAKRLGYFHNASYFELHGEDFDGVFRIGDTAQVGSLPPYVETIRLDRMVRLPETELVERSRAILREQLEQLPDDNPIPRFRRRLDEDLDWLRTAGVDGFHQWAFGTFRQCGASAEVGAASLQWLARATDDDGLSSIAEKLLGIAHDCKSLQFSLARLVRGRTVDVATSFDRMAASWDEVRSALAPYGR